MHIQSGMVFTAICLAALLASHGLRKGSLSRTGALAAFTVGIAHFSSGLRFGGVLIVFYLSSSKLTKWKDDLKHKLEADHVHGGARTASQVLANSLGGACCSVGSLWLHYHSYSWALHTPHTPCSCGGDSWSRLLGAYFVGFYACCCADTWSSEVGIASRLPPRLLTTLKVVPPGTNGGISPLGTAAAALGGLLMGLTFYLGQVGDSLLGMTHCTPSACAADAALIPLAALAGLMGSLLDSLLGATLQYSGFDQRSTKVTSHPPAQGQVHTVKHISGVPLLSNTAVNVVSSLATGVATAAAVRCLC